MRKGELAKPLPEHGTVARWRHRVQPCHGEECDGACRRAWNAYIAERRRQQRVADSFKVSKPPAPRKRGRVHPLEPGDIRHGTPGGYSNHGCRCDLCVKANSAASRERARRRRKVLAAEGISASSGRPYKVGPNDPRRQPKL